MIFPASLGLATFEESPGWGWFLYSRKWAKTHTTWTADACPQTVGRLRGGAIIGDISRAALAAWKLVLIRVWLGGFVMFCSGKYAKSHLFCLYSSWCLCFISMLSAKFCTCRELYIYIYMSFSDTPTLQVLPQKSFGKKPHIIHKIFAREDTVWSTRIGRFIWRSSGFWEKKTPLDQHKVHINQAEKN